MANSPAHARCTNLRTLSSNRLPSTCAMLLPAIALCAVLSSTFGRLVLRLALPRSNHSQTFLKSSSHSQLVPAVSIDQVHLDKSYNQRTIAAMKQM